MKKKRKRASKIDWVSQAEWQARTQRSLEVAVAEHGKRKVSAATKWLEKELKVSPGLFHFLTTKSHPYEAVIRLYECFRSLK